VQTEFCANYAPRYNVATAWTPQTAFCPTDGTAAYNTIINNCAAYTLDAGSCADFAYNAESCGEFTAFTFGCETCYPQYVRLVQSVAGTVTEVFKWRFESLLRSLRIKTKDKAITISAFSDEDLTTQVGADIVYTPTGVNVTTKFGITIKPSDYDQSYSIGAVEFERNND
jgi:hypothetical protein